MTASAPLPLRHLVIAACALGAVLVAWSELWFAPVPHTALAMQWLTYSAVAALMLTGLAGLGVRRWDGMILAAALAGLILEGVVSRSLYTAPPMSLLWPALVWHGMVSIGLGVVLYRQVMGRAAWYLALALNIALGLGLGAWTLYSWTALRLPGDTEVIYHWQRTADLPRQILLGYILMLLGHLILDLLAQTARAPRRVANAGGAFWILVLIALSAWTLGTALEPNPQALILLPLAGLCIWGMARHGRPGSSPVLDRVIGQALPLPAISSASPCRPPRSSRSRCCPTCAWASRPMPWPS